MPDRKPGLRERYKSIFYEEASKVPSLAEGIIHIHFVESETKKAIRDAELEFTQRPFREKVIPSLLDLFGFQHIIPDDLKKRQVEAEQAEWDLQMKLGMIRDRNRGLGGNLPGKHDFRRLTYYAAQRQFTAEFGISTNVEGIIVVFEGEGVFKDLRYRTSPKQGVFVHIPKTDTLSPVIVIPRGKSLRIGYVGYEGHGEFDQFDKLVVWTPNPASVPTPIDPREFKLAA